MSGNDINRRDFLKFMGLGGVGAATLSGCDMPTTVTLEEGKEKVVSYLAPEEYAIPGIGVYFASTCQQCSAACGVHGRVREGRLLKVEGNPAAHNGSGLCLMGQASVQGHYNPDRITQPLARKGGALTPVSWDEAWQLMQEKASGVGQGRSAWFTGTISGHQSLLLAELNKAWGSKEHYVYEAVNNAVGEAVNEAVLGDPMPVYRFDKAKAILSFGADFLGTWLSPTHFSREYATKFRAGDRGVLIQVEPKMTLTGGNADLWVAVRPGTEGVVALGIANVLLTKHQANGSGLSAAVLEEIRKYNVGKVTEISGVPGDTLVRIAKYLKDRSPSLILSGESAHNHVNGYQNAMAVMALNVLLGNIGKTIEASGSEVNNLRAKRGSSRALTDFAKAIDGGKYDAVFFLRANPVYTAPAHLALADKLAKVPFKVALSMFPDETTMACDLVLPLASPYEEWGTHMAGYQPSEARISVSQPLMNPLSANTVSLGDLLLSMLKHHGVTAYQKYNDYYAYLRDALDSLPGSVKGGKSGDAFWTDALQQGFIKAPKSANSLSARVTDVSQTVATSGGDALHLVPATSATLYDGRNTNLSWLQEAPDQITKIFWDSWAELHPDTAARLGVKEGDYIRIESDQGAIETQVYVYKGVQVDTIAVPTGRGHEEYGRFAKGIGVNPLKILSPAVDQKSGEIATYATRVRVTKTGQHADISRLGGSETQVGRRLVSSVSAAVFRRTEGA